MKRLLIWLMFGQQPKKETRMGSTQRAGGTHQQHQEVPTQKQHATPATADSAAISQAAAQTVSAAGAGNDDDVTEANFGNIHVNAAQNTMIHEEQDEFAEKNKLAQHAGDQADNAGIKFASNLVSDMPEEIRKNLIGADRIIEEEQIMKVVAIPGHIYTVDKIIMELWFRHKINIERSRVHQRLRALVHKGLLSKDDKARGIFTLTEAGKKIMGLPTVGD